MHGGTFWVGSFAEKLWPTPFSKAHLSSLNPFKLGRENKKLCFWRHCSGVLWESFRWWYQALTDFGSKLIAGQMLSWLENLPRYALWISQEIFLEMWKFALKCGNMLGNMEICLEICLEIKPLAWALSWEYGWMEWKYEGALRGVKGGMEEVCWSGVNHKVKNIESFYKGVR